MTKKNSVSLRLDSELEEIIRKIAEVNDISLRQASKEFARASKSMIQGRKITTEIQF